MSISLTCYYATMTGNAEALARRACERALNAGWPAQLLNLSEVKPADLADTGLALFIVSTWGDGEPPADATDFWFDLEQAPLALGSLRYAVLGLGDHDYQEFNAFAHNLDTRLAALGASRLLPRVDADILFEETYAEWEACVFSLLGKLRPDPQPATP